MKQKAGQQGSWAAKGAGQRGKQGSAASEACKWPQGRSPAAVEDEQRQRGGRDEAQRPGRVGDVPPAAAQCQQVNRMPYDSSALAREAYTCTHGQAAAHGRQRRAGRGRVPGSLRGRAPVRVGQAEHQVDEHHERESNGVQLQGRGSTHSSSSAQALAGQAACSRLLPWQQSSHDTGNSKRSRTRHALPATSAGN